MTSKNLSIILEELMKLVKKTMQDKWHVMLGSASALWTEATFHS